MNKKTTVKILCASMVLAVSFFALAAMLGQLDIILASWYSNPQNTWEMPFPFIFNHIISAMLGWELIYAVILVAFIVSTISAFIIGRETK